MIIGLHFKKKIDYILKKVSYDYFHMRHATYWVSLICGLFIRHA